MAVQDIGCVTIALVAACLLTSVGVDSLHLTGQWQSSEFFNFLVRFGFQQTNMHQVAETQGYIYGNITSSDNVTRRATFVVVDSEYFLYYFSNRSVTPRISACDSMFKKIDTIAWHETCHTDGKEDFLRQIPCAKNSLCVEETDPSQVVAGYQFTYHVQDTNQPR